MEHLAIMFVFSIPLLAIWTHHRRKVLEMQLRITGHGDHGVRAEVDALRQELRALRDTSTQYDLSFDAALQRMEQRMERVEGRDSSVRSEEQVRLGQRN